MKTIGITGGVGAGKTTVLNILKEISNCVIVPADRVAQDLLQPGSKTLDSVASLPWPTSIIKEDGSMDRPLVAQYIYSDEGLRIAMDDIVHPAVQEEVLRQIKKAQEEGFDYFFLEAALLIETGYKDVLDELWYIYASSEVRINRLMASRGYTHDKCESIIAKQLSDEEFRKNCDFVVDNSFDEKHVRDVLIKKLSLTGQR